MTPVWSPLPGSCLRRYLVTAVVLAGVLWTLFVFARVEIASRQDDAVPADAIVVLGTAQYQGTPSSIFQARLDHAYRLYENGTAPLVVIAGGKQEGDKYTEASAGAQYLRELGVPREALLPVGKGDSTLSSLEAVAGQLERRQLESVVLVSDPFHMYRSMEMAADLGLEVHGSPTTTSPVQDRPAAQLRYTLREVAAYTVYALSRVSQLAPESVAASWEDQG